MEESVQIENGLASLREAYFHLERAFFALHSTTTMSTESRNSALDLLTEMEGMTKSLRDVAS